MKFIVPNWPAPTAVKAYTTVREHWQGHPLQNPEKGSSEAIQSLLAMPREPIWLNQVHGNAVIDVATQASGCVADASIARTANRVCAVLTADCLPILICDTKGTHVAAIHAGWRGLAAGIIENTLQTLELPPEEILVWIGPAIGPCHFEVGADVYEAFTSKHAASASAFQSARPGKWMADLNALARLRLESQGVSRIYGGDFCTYCRSDLFFSYRRDAGRLGSMASAIWLEA